MTTEENAGFREVNQRNDVRLLVHELVLGELVVRDEIAELLGQVQDFLALPVRRVEVNLVVVVVLDDLVHALVEHT